VGVVLGLILGGLGLWAMNRGDGSVSRPVAAAETVAPVEPDEEPFSGESAAVDAAVSLYGEIAPTSPNWREVITVDVVGEADDIAALIETNELAEELLAESPTLADAGHTDAAGYRIVSYSDLDATVEVFRTDATGRTVAVPGRVVWRDDKWRLVAPEGGTWWGLVREVTQ